MKEVIIRKYKKTDRSTLRNISWQTAFMGKPANIFFDDKEIFADFLTLYFSDYEPQSSFVAEVDGRVIGYLIGTKNIRQLNRVFQFRILPRLIVKALITAKVFKKKNIVFLFNCLASFIKGEFRMPDFSKDYPAILHINIEENFRNAGIGSRLIAVYLDHLIKEGIRGVYLTTMSEKAKEFFTKQGFNLLHQGFRSYFRYILHKDISVYTYAKVLK